MPPTRPTALSARPFPARSPCAGGLQRGERPHPQATGPQAGLRLTSFGREVRGPFPSSGPSRNRLVRHLWTDGRSQRRHGCIHQHVLDASDVRRTGPLLATQVSAPVLERQMANHTTIPLSLRWYAGPRQHPVPVLLQVPRDVTPPRAVRSQPPLGCPPISDSPHPRARLSFSWN